jgi:hypothetical protein
MRDPFTSRYANRCAWNSDEAFADAVNAAAGHADQ